MSEHQPSRRRFISNMVLTGAGFSGLPLLSFADMRSIASNETTPAQKPQTFLFQGDSITDGNRGRTADPNHVMGHGYAFSIASRLGADFPLSGNHFYNRGVSGNTVMDLQKRWQTDTIDVNPDVLSILVGINDAAGMVEQRSNAASVDDFESVYRQLLTDAKNANPAIIFVIGVPFVYPVGRRKENWPSWKTAVAERSAVVKRLATEYNAVLVDYTHVFDKAMKNTDPGYWIWDGIHPTVPAHELMAREWIKQTSQRLPFLKRYGY